MVTGLAHPGGAGRAGYQNLRDWRADVGSNRADAASSIFHQRHIGPGLRSL